jgi:DNA polymerase I-like protein with 3'-5' exonuclease and polymerase domains
MSLNKSWAMASRSALRKEWRKGSCIEWQILNEIMNNKGVTKIALDIKSQLLCLRERDIIVNGPLEDPNIAALLLPTVFQLPSIIYEKELLNMQKLRIPKPSISINTENRSKSLFEPYRQSCFRAIAVFRLMVKYTDVLRKFGLLDLYRGVEMPLHISVIDAEYSGVPIQPNFFAIVRQDLTDRQNVISLHLKRINNEKNI